MAQTRAQSDVSTRDCEKSRDRKYSRTQESITLEDQDGSPVSLASETDPSMQEENNNHGTPIHHPRFTSHQEKLENDSTNRISIRPIPVHATLKQTDNRIGHDTTSEQQQTSSSDNEHDRSRPKRELSSDKLNLLSYKTTAPAIGTLSAKRIRFMSFDEILTIAKQSDSHFVSPSYALESVEELDLQLGEELKSTLLSEKIEGMDHSPYKPTSTTALASPKVSPVCVPLLTPPQSPRQSIEIVEWPSNLVVESALMSVMATDARPLSPASLTGEKEVKMETTGEAMIGDKDCTLTKRLSFITVGPN